MAKDKNIEEGIIMIGGIPYQVKLTEELRAPDGTKLDGCITVSKQLIEIDPAQSYMMQYQTLWHEVIHAILSQTGRRDHNEADIDAIAFGLVSTLASGGKKMLLWGGKGT